MKTIFTAILFIAAFQIANAQVNLTSGLIAYYPFSGNANDASGNNNHGIVTNAVLTSDRLNQPNSAYYFNGSSAYIRVPHSASFNGLTRITLSAFVRVQGFYTGICHGNTMIDKAGNADQNPGAFVLRYDDSYSNNYTSCSPAVPIDPTRQNFYAFGTQPVGPVPGASRPQYIIQEKWYSVIFTYDGIYARLYIDGVLQQANQYGLNFNNSYDVFFGKHDNASYPYWMTGVMDDIRIYNRAINPDEIAAISGSSGGGVGIGNTNPRAMLHVTGTVKFDSLPTGGGAYLLIGSDGNVVRASGNVPYKVNSSDSSLSNEVLVLKEKQEQLEQIIEALKKEIAELRTLINK